MRVLNIFTLKPAFGIQPLCSLSQGISKIICHLWQPIVFLYESNQKNLVNQKLTNLLQPVNGRNVQEKSNQQRDPFEKSSKLKAFQSFITEKFSVTGHFRRTTQIIKVTVSQNFTDHKNRPQMSQAMDINRVVINCCEKNASLRRVKLILHHHSLKAFLGRWFTHRHLC